jgi:hypothetical protein
MGKCLWQILLSWQKIFKKVKKRVKTVFIHVTRSWVVLRGIPLVLRPVLVSPFTFSLIFLFFHTYIHTHSLSFILSLFHNKSIRWLWLETQNYVSFFSVCFVKTTFWRVVRPIPVSFTSSTFGQTNEDPPLFQTLKRRYTHLTLEKLIVSFFTKKRKTIANACYEFFELNRINKSIEQKKWYRPLLLGVIHSRISGWKTHFVGLRWWQNWSLWYSKSESVIILSLFLFSSLSFFEIPSTLNFPFFSISIAIKHTHTHTKLNIFTQTFSHSFFLILAHIYL